MERESVTVQSVKDIQATGKRWLEGVLGRHLQENQQVFIMVFTPGAVPDDDARRQARAGLERTFRQAEEYAEAHGVTDEEADAAVDEAVREVRRRKNP